MTPNEQRSGEARVTDEMCKRFMEIGLRNVELVNERGPSIHDVRMGITAALAKMDASATKAVVDAIKYLGDFLTHLDLEDDEESYNRIDDAISELRKLAKPTAALPSAPEAVDVRHDCTCIGTCGVMAGERLGDNWRCVMQRESERARPQAEPAESLSPMAEAMDTSMSLEAPTGFPHREWTDADREIARRAGQIMAEHEAESSAVSVADLRDLLDYVETAVEEYAGRDDIPPSIPMEDLSIKAQAIRGALNRPAPPVIPEPSVTFAQGDPKDAEAVGEPVAWAVQLEDGTISVLGWIDMSKYEYFMRSCEMRPGTSIVYAYRAPASAAKPVGGVADWKAIAEQLASALAECVPLTHDALPRTRKALSDFAIAAESNPAATAGDAAGVVG